MGKKVFLEITSPCTESWEAMTPFEHGRFCDSCSKHVVDFTNMTDNEVLNFFRNQTGTVCGRINTEQVSKPAIKPINKRLRLFLTAFVMVFILCKREFLLAQDTTRDSSFTVPMYQTVITGKVVDEKNQPLDFASVQIFKDQQKVYGAKTDLNGVYKIKGLEPGLYTLK